MMNGIMIGIVEIFLFIYFSKKIRNKYEQLQSIHTIYYYWFMFTILTMIWEFSFIFQYDSVILLSNKYIQNKEHVWTNEYDLTYILPWKLSRIFYAEYGSYADKQYMINDNHWSLIIEGSHAISCGIGSLFGMINKINQNEINYFILISMSMGSQFMNCFLYLSNYFIQLNDPYNINYYSESFPSGWLLYKRPFMYINFFWMFMPLYIFINLIIDNHNVSIFDKKRNENNYEQIPNI